MGKLGEEELGPDQLLLQENMEMRKTFLGQGEIIINCCFEEVMMENTFFKLKSMLDSKYIDEITIYINSDGGEVTALTPLMDLLLSSKKPISTVVLGRAYSCAAFLLIAGTVGKRFAYPSSEILIHEPTMGDHSKSTQFEYSSHHLSKLNDRFIELLKSRTKMKIKDINRFMKSNTDIMLSAEEALKFGLIDKIVGVK